MRAVAIHPQELESMSMSSELRNEHFDQLKQFKVLGPRWILTCFAMHQQQYMCLPPSTTCTYCTPCVSRYRIVAAPFAVHGSINGNHLPPATVFRKRTTLKTFAHIGPVVARDLPTVRTGTLLLECPLFWAHFCPSVSAKKLCAGAKSAFGCRGGHAS